MQGYVNQSPVKQVWLPVDYNFIANNTGDALSFIKAYKEKYGIDLHELFEIVSATIESREYYSIRLKERLIGAYCDNDNGYSNRGIANFAVTNAIVAYDTMLYTEGSSETVNILDVGIVIPDGNFGFGFRFVGVQGEKPSTIDDLNVETYEI